RLEGQQRQGEEEAGGPQCAQLLALDAQDSVEKGSLPAVELDGPRVPEDGAGD
ncbi:hypothetical protein P7K49_022586, partial [Saguinus oedipus]